MLLIVIFDLDYGDNDDYFALTLLSFVILIVLFLFQANLVYCPKDQSHFMSRAEKGWQSRFLFAPTQGTSRDVR